MNLVVIVSMGFLLVFFIFGRELCVLFDVVVDMKVIVDNDNFVLSIMFYFCRLLIVFLDVRDVYEQVQFIRKKYVDEGRCMFLDYKVGDFVFLKMQSMNDVGCG